LEINGQEMNGYVIKSNQRNLTVQLENNERIETRCPKWDKEHLEYKYSKYVLHLVLYWTI